MVTVKIGPNERDLSDVDEIWVNKEINNLREGAKAICVRVRIRTNSLKMSLATPGCGGGYGRAPQPSEQKIFDLWKKHGLSQMNITGDQLVTFLKQLKQLL